MLDCHYIHITRYCFMLRLIRVTFLTLLYLVLISIVKDIVMASMENLQGIKYIRIGEDYVIRSFMICAPHQILFRR
jgi:hypothetical protein